MRKRLALAAAVVVALVAVGCSTNQATNVESNAATLNGDGNCAKGFTMLWAYQIRDATAGSAFQIVTPMRTANCTADSALGALPQERVTGLAPGHTHQFRILAIWKYNGQQSTATFDANGTSNGTNYDSFTTPDVDQVDASASSPERFIAPPDGIGVAGPGCRVKEITNPRQLKSRPAGTHLGTIRLTTAWQYCPNGTINKMYPAGADCSITDAGKLAGWSCGPVSKVRAVNNGGSPQHGAYTYSYVFNWVSPIFGWIKTSKYWCATNQISGSGAHKRHGSCDIQPW